MHSPWNGVVPRNKNSEKWKSQAASSLSPGQTRERVLASSPRALTCPTQWNKLFFSWCIWAVPRQHLGFLSLTTLRYSVSLADYWSSSSSYCCPLRFWCHKLLEAQKENMGTLPLPLPRRLRCRYKGLLCNWSIWNWLRDYGTCDCPSVIDAFFVVTSASHVKSWEQFLSQRSVETKRPSSEKSRHESTKCCNQSLPFS